MYPETVQTCIRLRLEWGPRTVVPIYGKGLGSQLAGGVGLVSFQITSRMQEENVTYFKYLGSMITNDAICTREIKSRIATAKASVDKNTFSPANWT